MPSAQTGHFRDAGSKGTRMLGSCHLGLRVKLCYGDSAGGLCVAPGLPGLLVFCGSLAFRDVPLSPERPFQAGGFGWWVGSESRHLGWWGPERYLT